MSIEITGTVCVSGGHLDPQGVMGSAGDTKICSQDITEIGLLRVYGKNGNQTLVKTRDGKTIKVVVSKQLKEAKKFLNDSTRGMFGPTFADLNGQFTAINWKKLSEEV